MSEANYFVHFQFLSVEPRFYALQSNEKLVARQEFLSAFDAVHKRQATLAYSLSGIRADCDLMLLRVTDHIESLQTTFERLRASGLGKHLVPAYTYLATSESKPKLGQSQYLFVCPWGRTREWYALSPEMRQERLEEEQRIVRRVPSLKLYTFDSFGLEGQETILACETDQPRDFLGIVKELKGTPVAYFLPIASTFLCTRKDAHEIVDALG